MVTVVIRIINNLTIATVHSHCSTSTPESSTESWVTLRCRPYYVVWCHREETAQVPRTPGTALNGRAFAACRKVPAGPVRCSTRARWRTLPHTVSPPEKSPPATFYR